jgi:DNA-binding NarL/FixJ family response regulator
VSIRVLIADDEQLVRSGFRMIVGSEADMEVVGEASDGRTAVELTQQEKPHVILMDVRMPHLNGIEATRRLTQLELDPRPGILMVTTFGSDQYLYGALRAGASGFILKDASAGELVTAVRAVARGECHLGPAMVQRLIEALGQRPPNAGIPSRLGELTERELDVLRLIAQGLTNCEIAAELVVSETTVKSHVGHIFAKLEIRDRSQAVVLAYESGLVTPSRQAARAS